MSDLNIEVGCGYLWVSAYRHEAPRPVQCVGERKGGFKLSNGWVVDQMGVAEGTNRQRGGRIESLEKENQ
ncbi:hypothetical protein [Paraburkholderia sp.]|uniref:hypothetical protein n=1 Tax=Paraburkholderia sp. TaxID=1926495 RepID=UPI0023847FAE|nr:hypothetical protein [Paraburkholderia sp.]MDE1179474.1 hypothetical protein [Paraburkholderia sp.]